jgi:hypothetical protein
MFALHIMPLICKEIYMPFVLMSRGLRQQYGDPHFSASARFQ